jgi:hypothetical protein
MIQPDSFYWPRWYDVTKVLDKELNDFLCMVRVLPTTSIQREPLRLVLSRRFVSDSGCSSSMVISAATTNWCLKYGSVDRL